MPRDGSGVYTLPPGNPVVPLTTITTTWANPTMSDISVALSDSLSRSGKGGMTASLRGPDGSKAQPTFSFTNEPATGRYRASDGVVVEAVDGNDIVRYTTTGLEQWNGSIWEPLTPRDAINTPFDPSTSALTSTNVQEAIEEVLSFTGGIPEAKDIPYDDTNVYFGAPTVQLAIDTLGIDLATVINDVGLIVGEISLINNDINNLTIRMNAVEVKANQNESDIGLLTLQFNDFYADEFLPLRQRVTVVENRSLTNESDIGDLQWLTAGAGNPNSLDQRITNNAGNIQSNLQLITINEGDIDAIVTQLGIWFPGFGDLSPVYGGTGGNGIVEGTGANILQDSPYLSGSPTAKNSHAGGSSAIATTDFVTDQGYLTSDDMPYYGSNSHGAYCVIKLTHASWDFAIQWNEEPGSVCDKAITYPIAFGSSVFWYTITANHELGGAACGTQVGVGILSRTLSGCRLQSAPSNAVNWIAAGLIPKQP